MMEMFCIITQSSGSMSMDRPELKYMGTDHDLVVKKIREEMEDFKKGCQIRDTGRYYRPDDGPDFDSWEDLVDSLIEELEADGKLIIDYMEWNCEEPGFFCVYKRVE